MERVGELEDDSEVLWISDPHTNIHFWKENGKFYTSKEFHLSKGGLEEDTVNCFSDYYYHHQKKAYY